ncbi:hypothetical protein NC653_035587 [Populus alba x Populus x berolinensis]|uniref:Uncharacterized protein n=1 Tax=Populus alba x Populus x berolinensis TaxID=444605 RepID=A0AAD6PYK2_9ROSI|nr:hypothetical protein NC653_035587 [Populus alba x Populus x berolinensis]
MRPKAMGQFLNYGTNVHALLVHPHPGEQSFSD